MQQLRWPIRLVRSCIRPRGTVRVIFLLSFQPLPVHVSKRFQRRGDGFGGAF